MISTTAVNSRVWRINLNCGSGVSMSTWLTSVSWSRLSVYRVDLASAAYGLYYNSVIGYSSGAQVLKWGSAQFSSGIILNADYSFSFAADGVYVFQVYLTSQFTSASKSFITLVIATPNLSHNSM